MTGWSVVDPVDDDVISAWPSPEVAVQRARAGAAVITGLPEEVFIVLPDEEDDRWIDVCIPASPPPLVVQQGWSSGDVVLAVFHGETPDAPQLEATCPWCGEHRVMKDGTTLFEICGVDGCGGMLVPDTGTASRARDRRIINEQAARDGLAAVIPLYPPAGPS
jgi:hypothetical protein